MEENNKALRFCRKPTKVNLETSGEFELSAISGNDAKFIYNLLEEVEDPREFTVQLLYNQIVIPEIDISQFKDIPENELMELARTFIKEEYNLSEYFIETTDGEFFSNFRDAIDKYFFQISKTLLNSVNSLRNFALDYSNLVKTIDLTSMIPKFNLTPLLIPKISLPNLNDMVNRSLIGPNSLIASAGLLNSISNTIYKSLIPQIDIWSDWTSRNRSIFQNFDQQWQKFEDKYKIAQEEAIKCLKKYKWFMTPSLPINFIFMAIKICRRGGNQNKHMNKLFIDYFFDDNFAELENLVEKWKNKKIFSRRMKVLRDCVSALKYAENKFNPSNVVIPTLIAQIDGIQKEFMLKNGITYKKKGGLKDADGHGVKWEDWYADLTRDDELLDSANNIFLTILFQEAGRGRNMENPFTFSRHKIMHGEYSVYGRKANTIRAFLILDFLASLMEEET